MIAVGVGFRSVCDADSLVELVLRTLDGRRAAVLAAPSFKAGAPALACAERLGLDLALVGPEALALAAPLCPTPMLTRRMARFGGSSIAEACALAAAGASARLIVPRVTSPVAACAVAGT